MGFFTKKEQIVILMIVFLIISTLSFKFIIKDLLFPKESHIGLVSTINTDITGSNEFINQDDENDTLSNSLLMVHISGQVYNPGIFQLVEGDRVIDAVKLAGGLTTEADLDRINLAQKVSDEEKIYIPKIDDETVNDNLFLPKESISSNSYSSTGKVNINKCSKSELESLPGIGEVIATRIIEYRTTNSFKTIEELKNVSGIGEKKFEGIKNLITVK